MSNSRSTYLNALSRSEQRRRSHEMNSCSRSNRCSLSRDAPVTPFLFFLHWARPLLQLRLVEDLVTAPRSRSNDTCRQRRNWKGKGGQGTQGKETEGAPRRTQKLKLTWRRLVGKRDGEAENAFREAQLSANDICGFIDEISEIQTRRCENSDYGSGDILQT